MEFDLSPYTRIGMGILAGRLIALYVSAYFVALQCFMLSIEPPFHMITVCDVYLILGWYVKMNGPTYIDGKLVTDRRIIFRERMRTRFFWDVMTLFPFEVFLVACYATLHPALSVGRSVGQSVGGWSVGPSPFFFGVFKLFGLTAPSQVPLKVILSRFQSF